MSKDLIQALEMLRNHSSVSSHQIDIIDGALSRHRSSVESVEAVAWQAKSKDNGTWGPLTTSRRVAESLASDGHEVRALCVAEEIRSLIAAAVEREREECAKVCDAQQQEPECPERAAYCAAAIRSRGEMK